MATVSLNCRTQLKDFVNANIDVEGGEEQLAIGNRLFQLGGTVQRNMMTLFL